MALYVQIADRCKADAKNLNLEPQLLSTKQSIEISQNLSGFDFLPPAVLKRKISRHFRLLVWQHAISDDDLIVFLRLLQRHRNDYPRLLDAIKANYRIYNDHELRNIHTRLKATVPVPPRPAPSAEERDWLHAVFQERSSTTDPFVFETKSWVEGMRGNKLSPLYQQLLADMTNLNELKAATSADVPIHWAADGDTGIAYHYRADLASLLLLEPLRRDSDRSVLDNYARRLSDADDQTALSRMAARSYPLFIVLDRDAWLAIQDDEESNLALSPEEAQLIGSIHATTGADNDLAYPLFINGLAGSGKSTILQYLASTYLDFALRRSTDRLPLYLTASHDLLTRARQIVRGLLTTNHERILEKDIPLDAIDRLLADSFRTFHDLLYSLLPPVRRHALRHDRHVNYATFRRLWAETFAKRPQARQLSVEVSWHVIRSLIKGIRSHWEDELDPDDFEDLPRRRRSVSSDTFDKIYNVVWSAWYKPLCEKEGYWDDQDLAASVLGTGVASKESRAAIFCDEAQDLTSADLDVIFQLSLYGRRALQPYELRRVPIIFAGDPLQTINPTGFRWDAVKADFHDRFCATIEAGGRSSIKMTYRDLRYNYRSNAGIVRFCNLLQLVHTALLDRSDIRPQDYWWREDPVSPTWFPIDDPATESYLRDHPECIKLINCYEGEETEYVESDPTLQRIVDQSEEGTYRNIMCPTRVKGLEFSAVVLYRFGEQMAIDFDELLAGDVDLNDPQRRLPWEYFFNRLYVAASRARDKLIVVDSEDTIDRFWKAATDPEIHDDLLQTVQARNMWKGTYAPLLRGTPEAWDEKHIDQRAQAERFAAQGARDGDPYLLRQAGLSYRSVDDDYRARRCFAQAAELEGKWQTAGDRYADIPAHDDAFRCYWKGRLWRPLKQLAVQAGCVYRLESRAADFMASGEVPPPSFLERLASAVEEEARLQEISCDPTWQEVLGKAVDRLANATHDIAVAWTDVFAAFDLLVRTGVPLNHSSLATCAYRGRNFEKAVELWQADNQLQRKEYQIAKAYVTPFPECLEFFKQVGDHAEILRRWNDARPSDSVIHTLSPSIAHTVADAALEQGKLALAAIIMRANPDRDRVGRLLGAAVKAKDDSVVCDGAIAAARLFVQTSAWKDVVDIEGLISIGKLAGVPGTEIGTALNRRGRSNVVMETTVWELAMSAGLVNDAPMAIASFLQQHFIGRASVQASGVRDHGIPENVVGAAIERSGRIVDALQYYENLLDDAGSTRATKRLASERLVCNLERHARYFERTGNLPQAEQQKVRAERLRKRWRIEDRDLDDYPQVGKPKEAESGDSLRTERLHSFWDSPTIEELARAQNVEPVSDVEEFFGTWPGDESDGFEAAIDALRHPDSGPANP